MPVGIITNNNSGHGRAGCMAKAVITLYYCFVWISYDIHSNYWDKYMKQYDNTTRYKAKDHMHM